MSIEAKHAYRFGYLKSEQWSNVRLEALARENGRCQICFEESLSNDAHHIWYPENIYDTRPEHLAILCRPCHDFVHAMLPECKTKDQSDGTAMWAKFCGAIIAWRTSKLRLFLSSEGVPLGGPKQLRDRLSQVEAELRECRELKGISKPATQKEKFKDHKSMRLIQTIEDLISKFRNNSENQ